MALRCTADSSLRGTFLTFSDYLPQCPAHGGLMRIRSIFVFTHDSIGLGEDGPTHQAVEHVASLRLIPNMDVWRPCDTEESVVAGPRRSSGAMGRHGLISPAEPPVPETIRRRFSEHCPRRLCSG